MEYPLLNCVVTAQMATFEYMSPRPVGMSFSKHSLDSKYVEESGKCN